MANKVTPFYLLFIYCYRTTNPTSRLILSIILMFKVLPLLICLNGTTLMRILGAKVHKGFLDIWIAIRASAVQLLTDALIYGGANNVAVVGHSLGGAVATLAGLEITAALTPLGIPVLVQTTGSPRVGSFAFLLNFPFIQKNLHNWQATTSSARHSMAL